jgi:hypothetical protein
MIDCIHSMAPKDEELLRHVIDGEPLPMTIKAHIDLCTVCQQRLATYLCTNSQLLSKLYRSQCPSSTRLSHYCVGMSSVAEATLIAKHLEGCPVCMAEVADTRRFFATSELFPEQHAPDEWTVQHTLQRIVASLVPRPLQLATRSDLKEASVWPRQYQADTISLSLHLSRDSKGDTILLGLISSINPDEYIEAFEGVKAELYCVEETELALRAGLRERQRVQSDEPFQVSYVDDLGNLLFKT